MFDFIDEQRSGGGGLQGLRSKLPQSELPADTLERVRAEIGTTENARVARRMVETCISFLQATGGKLVLKLEEQAGAGWGFFLFASKQKHVSPLVCPGFMLVSAFVWCTRRGGTPVRLCA